MSWESAYYREGGLDIQSLWDHAGEHGTLSGYRADGVDEIKRDDLLTLPCNILVPAALSNQIHAEFATEIKANIVVEASDSPVTCNADRILNERGVLVVPDILAYDRTLSVTLCG